MVTSHDEHFWSALENHDEEIAETLAHFGLDRRERASNRLHVGAAHRQIGFELRIV